MKRSDGLKLTVGENANTYADAMGIGNPNYGRVRQYTFVIVDGQGVARQETLEAANFLDLCHNVDRRNFADGDIVQSVTLTNDGNGQTAQQ